MPCRGFSFLKEDDVGYQVRVEGAEFVVLDTRSRSVVMRGDKTQVEDFLDQRENQRAQKAKRRSLLFRLLFDPC